ncbi:hypothetical protein CsSME_00011615 [Camellia sinensis var. sinensis]
MASKKAKKELPFVGPKVDALIKDKKPSMYSNHLIDLPHHSLGSSLSCKLGVRSAFAASLPSYLNKYYPCLEKKLSLKHFVPVDWNHSNLVSPIRVWHTPKIEYVSWLDRVAVAKSKV